MGLFLLRAIVRLHAPRSGQAANGLPLQTGVKRSMHTLSDARKRESLDATVLDALLFPSRASARAAIAAMNLAPPASAAQDKSAVA